MPKQIKPKAKPKEYFIVEWHHRDDTEIHHKGLTGKKETQDFIKDCIEKGTKFTSARVYKVIEVARTTISLDWGPMI